MRTYLFIIVAFILFSCKSKKEDPLAAAPTPATDSPREKILNDLRVYPDSVALIQNLTAQYLESELYDSALQVSSAALKRTPDNPELWDMQSVIYVTKGDTTSAILSLEKAVELYPLPDYIISLGALYAETKNAKALIMADALISGNLAQAEKEAYFIKGLYYSFKDQKAAAIPWFDKALAVDYHFMDAYLEKGLALYELGKYDDAVNVFTRAVTLQNNFDRGYFYLGKTFEKLNKTQEAVENYRKALLYDPQYSEAEEALQRLNPANEEITF